MTSTESRPWDPQDIADHMLGRTRPGIEGDAVVLQSQVELEAVQHMDTAGRHNIFCVWVAGYGGLALPLLWPMNLGRVRQGNRSDGTYMWAVSHRDDH